MSGDLTLVEQLQATLSKMEMAMGAIADAVLWTDDQHRVQWCNAAFDRLVSQPHASILNSNLIELFPLRRTGQPLAADAYPDVQVRQGTYETTEYELQQADRTLTLEILGHGRATEDGTVVLVIRDVTQARQVQAEHRRVEQEREDSLLMLQTTLEATADGILVVDHNRNVPVYNQKLLQMWSIPEVLMQPNRGTERLRFLAEQTIDPDGFMQQVWDLFLNQPDAEVRDLVELRDGRVFERYSQPQWSGDQIIGRVWTFRDITGRKWVEEALRRSNALLQAQKEASIDGILVVDENRGVVSCNQRFCQLWQISDELVRIGDNRQLLNQVIDQLDEPEPFLARMEDLYVHPEETSRDQVRLKDGRTFDHYSAPIRSPSGDYYGRIWYFRDITEQKQTEQTLRNQGLRLQLALEAARSSEAQYRDLVQTANSVILRWDTDGSIKFMNEYGLRFFGFDRNELLHQQIVGTIVPPIESSGRDLHTLMQDICLYPENHELNEHENICKNGDRVWISWANKPIYDEQGNLVEILSVGTDATAQKQARKALENSLSLLSATFESITDAIVATDRDGRITSYNQNFVDLWEIPPEQLQEMWQDPAKRLAHIASLVKNPDEFVQRVQALYVNPEDDSYDLLEMKNSRVVERYSCPQRVENDVIGRVWSMRDISDRKRAEETLRRSEEKLRLTLDFTDIASWEYQVQSDQLIGSENAGRLMGLAPGEEFNAQAWRDRLHPDDLDRARTSLIQALEAHTDFESEYRVVYPDGSLHWIVDRGRGIYSESGEPVLVLGIMIDISDLKQTEESLRRSEARLRALYESISAAVLLGDESGLVDCNSAATELFGYSRQELAGKHISHISPSLQAEGQESDSLARYYANVVLEEGCHRFEWVYRRSDGADFPADVCLTVVEVGDRRLFQSVIQDLTDRKQVEASLAERARLAAFRADVSIALAGSDRLPITLHQCAEAVVKHLDAAFARIWTLNAQEDLLELQASAGMYTHLNGAHSRIPVSRYKIGQIAQERQPYMTNSVLTDLRVLDKEWARREGMVAFAGYPLILDDDVIGVIAMFARHPLTNPTFEALGFAASEIALGIKRKQAEVALEKSLSLLGATFESITDGVIATDCDSRVMSYNQKFLDMWSIPPELILDVNQRLAHIAKQIKHSENYIHRVQELNATPEGDSYDLIELNDGRVFERYSCPQRVGETIVGRVWSFRDITDRKHAEEALRLSELKYRNIFENSQVGIGRTRIDDGLIVDANQRFAEILGFASAEEMIGKRSSKEFYVNPTDRQRLLVEMQQQGEICNLELPLRRTDGGSIWSLISLRLNEEDASLDFVIAEISDRKRLEEELLQSQKFLDTIIDNIPLAVFVKDVHNDFRYVLINKSSEKILGFAREGAIGLSDYELIPTLHADMHRTEDLAVVNQRSVLEVNEQLIDIYPNDATFTRGWKLPLFDTQGNLTHLLGIFEDITDRKHREEALRLIVEGTAAKTGDEFFQSCVRYLAEVLQVRYALVTTFADETQQRMKTLAIWGAGEPTGNFAYELAGTPCQQVLEGNVFYQPEGVQAAFPNDPDLAVLGAESYLGVPLVNSSGEILGHLAVMDVQPMEYEPGRELILKIFAARAGAELERKQAEEALQRRAQAESLLSSISRQFVDQEIDTAINFTLEAIAQLVGAERSCIFEYSSQTRKVQLLYEWCMADIQSLSATISADCIDEFPWLASYILNGLSMQIACVSQLPPEAIAEKTMFESHSIQSVVVVPMMHSGEVVGFVGADVVHYSKIWSQEDIIFLKLVGELIAIGRARHRAEVALRDAKEAAEAANRAKSTFLANMSHELRTPLNAILGFAQLMERDPVLTRSQRNALTTINRSGEHLLELINDVLEMSKIEAGRVVLNSIPFDLHALLHGIEEMFQIRADAKQLSLEFAIAPNLPQYILTDENKLRQVLINLLSNAVKFTQTGSVTLRARAEETSSLPPESHPSPPPPLTLYFEVEDTGCGISPDEIERLFQPFVQTASAAQVQEGTGLGLAISRQFVQLMSGDIRLTSVVSQGSTFYFDVKVALADPTDVAEPCRNRRVLCLIPNQPTYRILIVDDLQENRDLISQLLHTVGFETRTANNGQAAIAQWQTWHPHLIWMDMRMPIMNGYEATRHIRAQEARQLIDRTIIIALTASAFEEQRTTILAAGCDDLVRKPFREQLLFEKMAEHLDLKYVYEEQENVDAEKRTRRPSDQPKSKAQTLESPDLAMMPPEWIAQLHQAAIEVDAEQIYHLINQIPKTHSTLAETLSNLIRHFCFDEILNLTEM
ncbi:MAG: PAS domain S-box protein [Cyanobacteria bacterium CRU_2_1]|nr:PAS domain S-box protein [Cyanobacteria bacterium CRU_2_1]